MTPLEVIGLIIVAIAGAFTALARIYRFGPFVDKTDETDIRIQPVTQPIPPVVEPAPAVEPVPKYLWDTPKNVRHSVRVICDEEHLTIEQKNTLCATVGAESIGFNTKAINRNYVIRDGVKVLSSTDYGLCQWNDYWHGKEITPDEALNNPEKAVRLMCAYWKRGQRNLWIAYKNGSYKDYL